MTEPTAKAAEFMAANDLSPVFAGAATHVPGEPECPENVTGCRYSLEGGKNFVLSSADLRSLPKGYPKWKQP